MVALTVTLACLPLLVIDAVGASSSTRSAQTASAPEPSLVVANSPSTESSTTSESTTTTVVVATTVPTTAAPTTTVPRQAPVQVTAPPTVPPTTAAPAPTTVVRSQSDAQFLACVRERESHGDYTAVDSSGQYMGAYQIYQGGWDDIAARIGRPDLIGVAPNHASPADQDAIATAMLAINGRGPWGGLCG